MSKSVEERVVQMRFDNKQFESGVQTTLSTLDKLKNSLKLKDASQGLENVTKAAKDCDLSGIGKAAETIQVKFSALEVMAVTALANITNSALNAGKRIVSALTVDPIKTGLEEYETKMNAIQVIQANTRGKNTMEEITSALDELNTYADNTIYNFAQMTSNIGKFVAQGLDVNQATKAVQGMANLAAASGASAEDMSRATYQMSQALGGTIRKIDWNSLRNANMATTTLKDTLIEVAKIENNLDVRKMMEDKGAFEDTLELGWLSGDLFTEAMQIYSGVYSEAELKAKGYSEDQVKNFQDLAAMAASAATEVKTITQLWDVLKETAQSGWTQTWEYVIGDFDTAKKNLTQAQVYFSNLINASSDARNAVMKEWNEKGGRDDAIQALVNSFNALLSIATPVKEAFQEIFPPITAERLLGITAGLKELTAHLILGEETSNNLKRTFKGVFAIFDIGVQFVSALAHGLGELISYFLPAGNGLLSFSATMGDFSVRLNEAVRTSNIFGRGVGTVVDFIKNFAEIIEAFSIKAGQTFDNLKQRVIDFYNSMAEKFDIKPMEGIHSILERIHQRMTQVGEAAGSMKSGFVLAVEAMGAALANCKVFQFFETLWNLVTKVFGGILQIVGDGINWLINKISGANFNTILDVFNTGALAGIGVMIYKFVNGFGDAMDSISSFKDGILDILNGVKDCLSAYQEQLKAKTLVTIATAIGILAGSLLVLSLIDSDKLAGSLGAMTGLFAELMGTMAIMSKIDGLDGIKKVTGTMVGISVAVLILSSALKKIADLSFGEMMTGLVGVTGLMAVVTGSMIALSKFGTGGVKGATQMIILSVALKVLAGVLKDLGSLDLITIGKGLLGVISLMGTMVGAMVILSKFAQNGVKGATGMLILSAALKVLATVLADVGALNIETIGKGLLGVITLMGTMVGAMVLISRFAQNGIKGAVGMLIITGAIKVLSDVLADVGSLDLETIGKGILGIVTLMGTMVGAMILLSKFAGNAAAIMSAGISMVLVAASIKILSGVLEDFGSMDTASMIQGLIGIGVLLTEIALMLNAMTGTLGGAAALLVVSGALLLLTPVLSVLGAMPLENIAKALGTLAGVFIILGVAGAVLTPLVPTILGLAGAIALIGAGVTLFGVGLLAAGAGVTALAVGITALGAALGVGATAIVAGLSVIILGIAGLIPQVAAKLGEGIITFCKVIAGSTEALAEAVVAVVHSLLGVLVECVPDLVEGLLVVVVETLKSLANHAPEIVTHLMDFCIGVLNAFADKLPDLIVAAVHVLTAFFDGVVQALGQIDTTTLIEGILGVGLLAGLLIALGAVAGLVPAAMLGVLGMGVVIAELALMLAAVGALAQIPGLSWLIGEGGQFLGLVGNAIGSFVGGIVGGIAEGVTNSLPNIGTNLSAFMTNVQPFIDGAKSIDASMMDGVNALAQTILILTAADILNGLTSWFTGGSSLADFGEQLVPFGKSMKAYSDAISGIDAATVSASATAALSLAEFADKIPNTGGLVAKFTGENSITQFAEELVPFGASMLAYSLAIKGIDASAVQNSATAALSLAEMASKLPNSGGLVSWFSGENDMDTFASQLLPFGAGLKEYSLAVAGLDPDAINNSTIAAQSLSELANNLPNTGGLVSWFTGDNDIASFGQSLISFGEDFAKYSAFMSGVDSGIVFTTTNAANSIVELQKSLPKDGGWFSDDQTLSDFGADMSSFGAYFAAYYSNVSGINVQQLDGVIAETTKLVALANSMNSLDTSGMSAFGQSLLALGNSGITEFVSAFTNSYSEVNAAVTTMMGYVSQCIVTAQPNCALQVTTLVNQMLTAMRNKYTEFYTVGSTMFVQLIAGIKVKDSTVKQTCILSISGAVTAIKNKRIDFYNAGVYLVEGFINGIADNIERAAAKAAEMAKKASEAANKALDIHSPSRVTYKTGNFFGLGFVNAIMDKVSDAENAGATIANAAKSSLTKAVSKIKDWMDTDIDTQPTIRPVLDLSDVESDAMRLNTLFSNTQAVAARSEFGRTSAGTDSSQNGGNNNNSSGNTYTFTQNNYSPKALSRIDIYRQTKNQFSAMKEVLE